MQISKEKIPNFSVRFANQLILGPPLREAGKIPHMNPKKLLEEWSYFRELLKCTKAQESRIENW